MQRHACNVSRPYVQQAGLSNNFLYTIYTITIYNHPDIKIHPGRDSGCRPRHAGHFPGNPDIALFIYAMVQL